jgi:hypothetical protein
MAWYAALIEDLIGLLEPDDTVLALILYGSVVRDPGACDLTSDVDVCVVTRDGALENFFPSLRWLRPLGTIYAFEQHDHHFTHTTRVCFDDFRRLDIVITDETGLCWIHKWPSVPFWRERRVLFSRSRQVDRILQSTFDPPTEPLIAPDQFQSMVNEFWFKAVVAVNKVMRNDLLAAIHLCRDLDQECLVLGMLLRDRELVQGREGVDWNYVASELSTGQRYDTATEILNALERGAIAFDQLAGQWSPRYRSRQKLFGAWLARVRGAFEQ